MWDEYIPNSLKLSTRTKRRTGTRRRVLPDSKIPENWQSLLRLEESKQELYKFLAPACIAIETQCIIISNIGNSPITNGNYDLPFIAPSNHEEAHTRMLLDAKDDSQSGMKKVLIGTVDTDVVAIPIGLFGQLDLLELWLAIGTGNHFRYIEIHKITAVLSPEKSKCLPLFHAFTRCDQVSFFVGRGKKAAWNTWNHFGELTTSFSSMSLLPKLEDITSHSPSIERFVVLLYDRTSTISTVNKCRKDLFTRKDRPLGGIPPSSDVLMQHLKRALYQASYSWA